MKVPIISIIMLFSIIATAQSDFKLRLGTWSGYEHNVFNVNAEKQVIVNGESERALKSGFYQNLNIMASWKIKSKYHDFSLNTDWEKNYFPQLTIANLQRSNLGARYKLKIHKRHAFTFAGKLKQYKTNRPEDDTEVLRPPRSYNRMQYSLRYNFDFLALTKIYLQATKRNNRYVTSPDREFYYHSLKYEFSLEQKLYDSDELSHQWNTKASLETRIYNDIEFTEIDEESFEEREWKYYGISTEYEFKVKNKFRWVTGLSSMRRQDLIQNRYGYNQLQPYMKMSFTKDKLYVSLKASYAHREYHTLKANDAEDVPLIHNYLRGSISIKYKMSDRLNFYIRSSLISRSRNLPEGATSFLAYDNALVSVGVRYNLL